MQNENKDDDMPTITDANALLEWPQCRLLVNFGTSITMAYFFFPRFARKQLHAE